MKRKPPSLDDLIRMAVQKQEEFRQYGAELHWSLTWRPIEPKPKPEKDCPPPKKAQRT